MTLRKGTFYFIGNVYEVITMSAFMMSNETLSMIANIIDRHYVAGFNSFGFSLSGEMQEFIFNHSEKPIGLDLFKKLAELNEYALHHLYHFEHDIDVDEMIGKVMYIPSSDIWQNYNGKIDIWHYQLLKSLDCYLYQTGDINNYYYGFENTALDDETKPMMELFGAIMAYRNDVANYIVSKSSEYEQAKWG